MKRLFVLTIKYIPIIQLIGMLINNSLYTYDINIEFDYIGDFLLGNSIVNISMLYICSDKGFHTKGEAVARCDNELPLSSF